VVEERDEQRHSEAITPKRRSLPQSGWITSISSQSSWARQAPRRPRSSPSLAHLFEPPTAIVALSLHTPPTGLSFLSPPLPFTLCIALSLGEAACVNEAVKIATNMSYNLDNFMQFNGQEVDSVLRKSEKRGASALERFFPSPSPRTSNRTLTRSSTSATPSAPCAPTSQSHEEYTRAPRGRWRRWLNDCGPTRSCPSNVRVKCSPIQ